MWLRDRLTIDLRHVRVLLYGHDTHLGEGQSAQTVENIAFAFMNELVSVGQSSGPAKPLVFIAHSLGGTVLKRALIGLAGSSKSLKGHSVTIKEIFLFGVPNRGIPMSHLVPMVCKNPQGDVLPPVHHLSSDYRSSDSHYVEDLDEQFIGITAWNQIRILYFFETKTSRTADVSQLSPPKFSCYLHSSQISGSGQWNRNGPLKVLVEEKSAIRPGSDTCNSFSIHEDHFGLIKFKEGSSNYQFIARNLYTLSESLTTAEVSITEEKSLSKSKTGWAETLVMSSISKLVDWSRGKLKDSSQEGTFRSLS
jgi:hypothetical protein